MKQLFIFRHGETDWNKEGRFQGHIDIPINASGQAQAAALIPKLQPHGLDVILSSDLIRAQETARIVADVLSIPIFTHEGLREAHLGHAQGLRLDEIESRFGGELVTRWRSSHVTDADISYPGGETGVQVMERAFRAMEGFFQTEGDAFEKVGISTHGGVIRRIMQRVLPPGSGPVPIPNGVLYHLYYNERTNEWSLDSEKFRL